MAHRVFWRSAILSFGVLFVVGAAAVLPQACSTRSGPPAGGRPDVVLRSSGAGSCLDSTTAPSTTGPDLDCAAPPNTFAFQPFVTSSQAALGPTVDSWAWASFAAMNWPALTTTDTADYPTGYVRGIPDPNASFIDAQSTDVAVWETFKEKREVFNNIVTATQWQQSTYPPNQTPDVVSGGLVPACAPGEKQEAKALVGKVGLRVLAQTSKVSPALVNDLDETAEVASPAQESQNDLCLPYLNATTYATCMSNFPPAPGDDATSIYPSNIINPRTPVGPRVFDPSLDPQKPENSIVFYEVRLNYDYFNYVVSNGLNFLNPPNGQTASTPLVLPPYHLPWRTSAVTGPGPGGAGSVSQYDATKVAAMYAKVPAPAMPPAVGSIQVKSAWKLLPGGPLSNYHTTQAVHFNTISASPYVCYAVDTFGLIGLHIIQRVHTGNTLSGSEPWGGTFIFATWEHNSIRDSGGYKYVNFAAQGGADQSNPTPYPPIANALAVTALGPDPSPLATTTAVTSSVYKALNNPNSVWNNYRLVGTQFIPMSHTDSLTYNQPYYLANLVVETNRGLQNFQGLPRGVTPNAQYNGFPAANTTAYDPTQPNVAFQNQYPVPPVDMGGCMGCHGVAQVLGSSFSFVLFDGPRGAAIDTPSDVAIPPNPPPTNTSGGH
jgi:hypothetical protein